MAKKKQPARVEPVEEPVVEPEEAVDDSEEVTCPVCGKPVGLEVTECPHCGAEFESEEVEEIVEEEPVAQPQKAAPEVEEPEEVGGDNMAECPVCGNSVSLDVPACPYCGAEFEEEEVEEVIEVEEEPEPVPVARPRAAPVVVREEEAVESEEEEVEEEEEAEVERVPADSPTSITDLRVLGVSLIFLGILGSQISFFIDWYWTWVPPIEDNLGMFMGVAAAVVVVGLLIFLLYKRLPASKKAKKTSMVPRMSLSIFLFGIFAVAMVLLWDPINAALQNQSLGVAVAFIAVIIVGVLAMFMGQKMNTRASAA